MTTRNTPDIPPPDPTLEFAEKLLALLDTGSFMASYKYALLLALLDETLEQAGTLRTVPEWVRGRQLGRRVLELYWPSNSRSG